MGGLYGDGIIALKGAFSRQYAQELGEDIEHLSQAPMSGVTSTVVRLNASEFRRRPVIVSSGDGKSRCRMFPPKSMYPRYGTRAQQKMPKMLDISARSALTIHRGTPNQSTSNRPALVLGVDAPDARNAERHDFQITRRFFERLPADLRAHMTYRLVDELEPIVQAHTIEGLVMGETERA